MTLTDRKRRIESAKRQAIHYRNYRRCRDRALTRLSNVYPEIYKELLEQEKVADVEMGKKWLDLDGSTSPALDTSARANLSRARNETASNITEGERK